MNVACPTCATMYRVDPAKVPPAGVRARCGVCAAVFPVSGNGTAPSPGITPMPPRVSAPVPMVAPGPTPVIPPPAAAPPIRPPVSAPPAGGRPAIPTGLRPSGMFAPPSASAPNVPMASPRPSAPVVPPRPAAAPVAPLAPLQPSAAVLASPPVRPAAGQPARSMNPFMSQDPSQKARRLARALISDLVVYGTARRDEALRNGTLKESFGEEIKKSWEEFVDQVGKEMAESTTYFNDALNEILSGGQKIF